MHDPTLLLRCHQFQRVISEAKQGNPFALSYLTQFLELEEGEIDASELIKRSEDQCETFRTNLNAISSSN